MPHYTSQNQNVFIERIIADFIGQIAQRLESSSMSQSEFADRLDVSESEVSQVLNLNRMNLTLKKMAQFAFGLGMKFAVVAYDDHDPYNDRGPVGSEIFNQCWEISGRPRNVVSTTNLQNSMLSVTGSGYGWMNNTLADPCSTVGNLRIPTHLLSQSEKATTAYART